MKVYRVIWENSFYGDIDIEIPRSEITAIKKQIKADGWLGYNEMLRIMSHSEAIARYCLIPGTNFFRFFLNLCIFGGRILFVVAIGLLFGRLWWWSLGLVVFYFLVVSNIQTMINYEIGSRLFALDQRLEMNRFTEQENAPDRE